MHPLPEPRPSFRPRLAALPALAAVLLLAACGGGTRPDPPPAAVAPPVVPAAEDPVVPPVRIGLASVIRDLVPDGLVAAVTLDSSQA